MDAVNVASVYLNGANSSDLFKTIFGMSLMPNTQDDEGNFFSRHGLIGMTTMDRESMHPIQKLQDINSAQGKKFRCYLGGFLVGEPDIGRKTASDNAQTLQRSYFDFETVAVYGRAMEIPDNVPNKQTAIPIIQNYSRALREWWGNLSEELIITMGLCSMRGQADNYEALTTLQGAGNDTATASASGLTETMAELAKVNPLFPPQIQFTAWHDKLNFTSAINPSAATADGGKIKFSDIRAIQTFLAEQNRKLRGVRLEPGRMGATMQDGEKSPSRGWTWLINPAVRRSLLDNLTAGEYADIALKQVQATGKSRSITDGEVDRLYGFDFITYRKMPRYFGGASGDVPISRTMILGKQACVFGVRSHSIPANLRAGFNERMLQMSNWGMPVRTWVHQENKGRYGTLQSEAHIGISAMYWKNVDGSRIDTGRIAYDCTVQSSYNDIV